MRFRIGGEDEGIEFLNLGKTPLANNFLKKEQVGKEETYPLVLAYSPNSHFVQLTTAVPAEKMFKEYVYMTSTTKTFQRHFKEMADRLMSFLSLDSESFVVDIGSNDGLLLQAFQVHSIQVVGVEPAENIAKIARERGVGTINGFFSSSVVQQIIANYKKASLVTANNVFAHVDDIDGFTKNVYELLEPEGVFVIEFQYFVDTVETMTFDNVYHEHVSYYTITSLEPFFKRHGFTIFFLEHIGTHGGSIRAYMKKSSSKRPVDPIVSQYLSEEKKKGILTRHYYENFGKAVYEARDKLVRFVKDIKSEGKTIAGYGAPAKANTLLNFCGIGREYISYIVDDNPLKQGLYTPGTHIPVFSAQKLVSEPPDCLLILAWNFAQEILQRTKDLKGVTFIIPLPTPQIVQG
ncbi:class I SAM-dependent methyltransferase [Candidatus Woesearchaeota archaeon]|nr:class I SAM-dependent methyltransferase [Candidatus Woesearchaeota archaeon]